MHRSVSVFVSFGVAAMASIAVGCSSISSGPSCTGTRLPADQLNRISIPQGLAGSVWLWEGDFQPQIGAPSCGTVTPVIRTLLVYPLTARADLPQPQASVFFVSSMPGAPIDSVRSDSTGFFQLPLAPGSYSVVVQEGIQLYGNVATFDIRYVGGVVVLGGTISRVAVDINYRASF